MHHPLFFCSEPLECLFACSCLNLHLFSVSLLNVDSFSEDKLSEALALPCPHSVVVSPNQCSFCSLSHSLTHLLIFATPQHLHCFPAFHQLVSSLSRLAVLLHHLKRLLLLLAPPVALQQVLIQCHSNTTPVFPFRRVTRKKGSDKPWPFEVEAKSSEEGGVRSMEEMGVLAKGY